MESLDFEQLSACAEELDALVARTPGIDRFCSSSAWVLPAQAAFASEAEPFVSRGPAGIVALMRLTLTDGRVVGLPLEAGWGLAAPFAGPDPAALADQLAAMLTWPGAPTSLYLSGLERDGALFRAIIARLSGRARFGLGQACERRVAAIHEGLDAWLATRSPKFRTNLRRARRRAEEAGYHWTWLRDTADPEALFERIMRIEQLSWKGLEGVGVHVGPAREFYRQITLRLAATGRLRVMIGQQAGREVAYVLGGVFADTFRGLQLSYVAHHRAHALGNVAQLETIAALSAEGIAEYDLGTEMEYKARWAPEGLRTVTLAVFG